MKKYIAGAAALLLIVGYAYTAYACGKYQQWVCTTYGNQTRCSCV